MYYKVRGKLKNPIQDYVTYKRKNDGDFEQCDFVN